MLRTLLLCLSLSTPALAQDGALAGATPGQTLTGAQAETLGWTTGPVELKRFPDADAVTLALPADAQVTVVLVDGDRYRVRRGTDFGWLAADQLSLLPPASALPPSGRFELTPPPF